MLVEAPELSCRTTGTKCASSHDAYQVVFSEEAAIICATLKLVALKLKLMLYVRENAEPGQGIWLNGVVEATVNRSDMRADVQLIEDLLKVCT